MCLDAVELTPAHSPPARSGASMAYDPATASLTLFGGEGTTSDTWTFGANTWDVAAGTWNQLSPSTSPQAWDEASLAFKPGTGQLSSFVGGVALGSLDDLWTWDGNNWTSQSETFSPSQRRSAAMVGDPATAQLVLSGGLSGGPLADTWALEPEGGSGSPTQTADVDERTRYHARRSDHLAGIRRDAAGRRFLGADVGRGNLLDHLPRSDHHDESRPPDVAGLRGLGERSSTRVGFEASDPRRRVDRAAARRPSSRRAGVAGVLMAGDGEEIPIRSPHATIAYQRDRRRSLTTRRLDHGGGRVVGISSVAGSRRAGRRRTSTPR